MEYNGIKNTDMQAFMSCALGIGSGFEEKRDTAGLCAFLAEYVDDRSLRGAYMLRDRLDKVMPDQSVLSVTGGMVFGLFQCPDKSDGHIVELIKSADEHVNAVYCFISDTEELSAVYERLIPQMQRSFYTDGTGMLCRLKEMVPYPDKNCKVMAEAITSSNSDGALLYIEAIFCRIAETEPEVMSVRKYCLSLYIGILMRNKKHDNINIARAAVDIMDAKSLAEIKRLVITAAAETSGTNLSEDMDGYSALIKETIHIINSNIGNEELSLRWIAGNILYTNVDYLGKLFKKETGRNFSNYVMEKRMELAKRTIIESSANRIYEVAERVGYGVNSQYFSQVFKKYTGVSPLEYKEYTKKLKSNMV